MSYNSLKARRSPPIIQANKPKTTFKELEQKLSHIVQKKINGEWDDKKGDKRGRNDLPPPSTSIVLKGLAPTVTEDEIRSTVYRTFGLVAANAKIARDRRTNESRGFGFLDFDNMESSSTLMKATNGGMYIGQNFVQLEYSHKTGMHQQLQTAIVEEEQIKTQEQLHQMAQQQLQQEKSVTYRDWICESCSSLNFSHRTKCYSCFMPKTMTAMEVLSTKEGESSLKPTVELIVRGLAMTTTEETLHYVFGQMAPVRCVRIIRDKVTMASRQFGFVEFFTLEEAMMAMTKSVGLAIDGVLVNVTYARRQHLDSAVPADETLAAWQSYYNYGEEQKTSDPTREIERLIQQGYVYDESSGYYYNATLNYHYDINTKYFYDNNHAIWVYFDTATGTYQPVEQAQQQQIVEEEKKEEKKPIGPELPQEVMNKEEITPSFSTFSLSKKGTSTHDASNITKWNSMKKELHENADEPIGKVSSPPTVQHGEKQEIVISKAPITNPKFLYALKKAEKKEKEAKEAEFKEFLSEIDSLVATTSKEETSNTAEKNIPATSKTIGHKRKRAPQQEGDLLSEDNVGNKMLKKLGWSEGEGLGKNKSGITAPIDVQIRGANVGLGFDTPSMSASEFGSKAAKVAKNPGDTYQDMVYKSARKRYEGDY